VATSLRQHRQPQHIHPTNLQLRPIRHPTATPTQPTHPHEIT
jgi:hypothetical protein